MPTDALDGDQDRTGRTLWHLVFEVSAAASPLGAVADAVDDSLTIERVVPASDRELLAYGSTTADPSALEGIAGVTDGVADARVIADRDADRRVEIRLLAPPLLAAVRATGGDLTRFRMAADGGILEVTAADDDGSVLVDELAGQSGVVLRSRATESVDPTADDPLAKLTSRQREVLVTAYHAGFFEWPRASDGEEVADSLGIAQPTFVEHLRRAEQSVLAAILGDE